MRYLVVIVGLLTLGAAGAAGAEEPDEVSYGLPPGGIEVHLPTPPQEQLAGADILVQSWDPRGPSTQQLDTKSWKPSAPERIPVPLPYSTPAMSWLPGEPSAVPVRSWRPGEPSRIVVHGAY